MRAVDEALTWAMERHWLMILVPIALGLAVNFLGRPYRAISAELHAFAMSRARGVGGWSVHVMFDTPPGERVELRNVRPCGQDFAKSVTEGAMRMAEKLCVKRSIVSGSDC